MDYQCLRPADQQCLRSHLTCRTNWSHTASNASACRQIFAFRIAASGQLATQCPPNAYLRALVVGGTLSGANISAMTATLRSAVHAFSLCYTSLSALQPFSHGSVPKHAVLAFPRSKPLLVPAVQVSGTGGLRVLQSIL